MQRDQLRPQPPMQLAAGAFRLTAMHSDDWPVEVALSRDPDVVRWTFYPSKLDSAGARERVEGLMSRAAQGISQWYVIRDERGDMLGTCGLGKLQLATPEVFYSLLAAARGRGAATEAVTALVAWALANGWTAVALETVDGNAPSENVARRSGFEVVERFQDDHRGEQVWLTRWKRPGRLGA